MIETEQAFWLAILSSPGDSLPRLVYSDWLEEQGRSEAEVGIWRLPRRRQWFGIGSGSIGSSGLGSGSIGSGSGSIGIGSGSIGIGIGIGSSSSIGSSIQLIPEDISV